jgi:DNA-binding NtrC family response regulator
MLRSLSPFQKKQPCGWPAVVCGQFRANPQLARSELFGHVCGAFTGATRDRQGLMEQADGDTLFFDEVADIDHDTQRLLMAAIEGRGFQRLGDTSIKRSRFRLVCATNRTMADLRAGLLDEDFLDRIAVFVLAVPPLRRCREDLPDAWRRVLLDAVRKAGVRPEGWERFIGHPQVLAAIAGHPLPGNFRDLQRAAFRLLAAVQAGRREIGIVAAAVEGLGSPEGSRPAVPAATDLAGLLPLEDLRAQVEAYEAAWLRAALARASGNKSEAARLLGLARKTFEHRLRVATRVRQG